MNNQNRDLRKLWWFAFFSTLTMFGLMTWLPVNAANVSGVNKTNNSIIVQGRDGTSSVVRVDGLPLFVQSTNYTITTTDGYEIVEVTTGASQRTITLPPVSSSFNRVITIKKMDSGAGTVLINVNGGSIQGASSNVLNAQYSYVTLKSDGAIWNVISVYDFMATNASGSLSGSSTFTGINGILLPPGTWSTTVFFTMVGAGTTFTAGNGCQASYVFPAGSGTLGTTMIQGYPGLTGSSTSASVFTGSLNIVETFTTTTQTGNNMWAVYTGGNPTVYATQRSVRIN